MRISKALTDGIRDKLLQHVNGDGHIITKPLAVLLAASIVKILLTASIGGSDEHCAFTLSAKDFTLERVVSRACRAACRLALICLHPFLYLLKGLPVYDGRKRVFHNNNVLRCGVAVPRAVRALGDFPIHQIADIFGIFEEIVQAVNSKISAALRTPLLGVKPADDLAVRHTAGVQAKDQPHRLGLGGVNNKPTVDNLIAKRRSAARVQPLTRHKAHFLDDLLPRLQNPHLIKQRHTAFSQKSRRVTEIPAYHRLRHRHNIDTEASELVAEIKPRGKLAKHAGLVVYYHGIGSSMLKLPHHAGILRAGVFHAAGGLICKNIKHRQAALIALFAAGRDLNLYAVLVLPVRGVARKDICAMHQNHLYKSKSPFAAIVTANGDFVKGYSRMRH